MKNKKLSLQERWEKDRVSVETFILCRGELCNSFKMKCPYIEIHDSGKATCYLPVYRIFKKKYRPDFKELKTCKAKIKMTGYVVTGRAWMRSQNCLNLKILKKQKR